MTTHVRLVIAGLLSLAFHAAVISGEWLPMPLAPGTPRPLEARLASLPELKPAAPKPRIRAPRRITPVPIPEVAAIATPGPFFLPGALDDEDMAEAPSEEPAAPEPPQRLALAAPTIVDAATAHGLPRRARLPTRCSTATSGNPLAAWCSRGKRERNSICWQARPSRRGSWSSSGHSACVT